MRLPRVRFTVRRTMILVALVALLIAGERLRRRVANFQRLADSHADLGLTCIQMEQDETSSANDRLRRVEEFGRRLKRRESKTREAIQKHPETEDELASQFRQFSARMAITLADSERAATKLKESARESHQWAAWHALMKKKYQRAMWRPWEALGPRPEPPRPLPESYDPDTFVPDAPESFGLDRHP